MTKQKLLVAYNKLKAQMDSQRNSETLKKFYILKKAYSLGIKIYGRNHFSIVRLALDFEIPITTVKRVLSLSKANKRTWKLIKSKKISSFKVAMALLKKDTTYQDEIVDLIIKDKLSTYQINSLNIRKLSDIKKERLRISIDNGFARASTAYLSLKSTLDRLEELLQLDLKYLPAKKFPELKMKLEKLNQDIENYLEKIE